MSIRRAILLLCLNACAKMLATPTISPTESKACDLGTLPMRMLEQSWKDLPALRAELAAAALRCPDSADVQELVALMALMRGDDRGAALAFMRAAADLNAADAELYLGLAANFDLGRKRALGLDHLAAALSTRTADPQLRPRAIMMHAWLTARFVSHADAKRARAPLGYIADWRIIGPFDNDEGKGFRAHYPPEDGVDFSATHQGKLMPLRWRQVHQAAADPGIHFGDVIAPQDHATVYAAVNVYSDVAQAASLRGGFNGATQIFCNGALVFAEEHLQGRMGDNVIVKAPLLAGWNALLLKVSAQHSGRFSLRVAGADGLAKSGLTFSTEAQPVVAKQVAAPLPASAAVSQGSARELLHAAWRAERDGRSEERLPPLAAWVTKAPDNPLAIYFSALAHWDKGENGTAIDLIERAVAGDGGALAKMHAERARFFGLKRQPGPELEALNEATKLAPQSVAIARNLTAAYAGRAWNIERSRILQALLDDEPDLISAVADLADAMRDRGYQDFSDRLYGQAAALEPGRNARHETLLAIEERQGELDDALRRVQQMQQRDPLAAGLAVREADLARKNGDRARAVKALERAIGLNPDWALPYMRVSEIASEAGETAHAIAFLDAAHVREPKNVWVSDRIAFLRHDKAAELDPMVQNSDAIEALARKDYPDAPNAHTLDILDESVCDIHQDGSERCIITEIARVQDISGRDALTQIHLRGGANKVLLAAAYSKSGERSEAASVNESSVRFRQLDVGSTVLVRYEHNASPARFLPNHYASRWYFSAPSRHMRYSRWVLRLDKGTPLTVRLQGNVQRKDSEVGNTHTYEFIAENLPAIVPEPAMPPLEDVATIASVSTVPGWEDYVRWERALLFAAYRSTPEIKTLARKLTADATTTQDKLDRLYLYTAQEIRYQQEYETSIAGVKPHACPVVVERGYGDCKDKALLFIALAKAVGIEARFAILRTSGAGSVEREIPNQQFNHAIVYVPAQAGLASARFIDPTVDALDVGNLRADDQGATALVLSLDDDTWSFVDIPWDAAELQAQTHTLSLVVKDETSATATDTITLRGSGASQLRVLARNKERAEKLMQTVAAGLFSSATLTELKWPDKEDITAPLQIQMAIDASRSLREIDGNIRIRLPGIPPLIGIARIKTRRYPLHFGPLEILRYEQSVTLPKTARIVHMPREVELKDSCLHISRSSKKTSDGFTLTTIIDRRCTRIEPAAFGAFRTLLLSAQERLEEELEISLKPKPGTI